MTESVTERDIVKWQEIKEWVCAPSKIRSMEADELLTKIEDCVFRIERVRMGGRSASIFAMSVLLWYGKSKIDKNQIDIEQLISLGLGIITDPSFVQPEMGIILVGILVARYSDWLPDDCREETLLQTKLMLDYFAVQDSYPNQVRSVALLLTISWNQDFEIAIQEAISVMKSEWPETTAIRPILSSGRLEKLYKNMGKVLPAWIGCFGRSLYRLQLERKGCWEIIESFKLE